MPLSLSIRFLGVELFGIDASTEAVEAEDCSLDGGLTASTAISFTASPGDSRWNPGADYGAGEPEDDAT